MSEPQPKKKRPIPCQKGGYCRSYFVQHPQHPRNTPPPPGTAQKDPLQVVPPFSLPEPTTTKKKKSRTAPSPSPAPSSSSHASSPAAMHPQLPLISTTSPTLHPPSVPTVQSRQTPPPPSSDAASSFGQPASGARSIWDTTRTQQPLSSPENVGGGASLAIDDSASSHMDHLTTEDLASFAGFSIPEGDIHQLHSQIDPSMLDDPAIAQLLDGFNDGSFAANFEPPPPHQFRPQDSSSVNSRLVSDAQDHRQRTEQGTTDNEEFGEANSGREDIAMVIVQNETGGDHIQEDSDDGREIEVENNNKKKKKKKEGETLDGFTRQKNQLEKLKQSTFEEDSGKRHEIYCSSVRQIFNQLAQLERRTGASFAFWTADITRPSDESATFLQYELDPITQKSRKKKLPDDQYYQFNHFSSQNFRGLSQPENKNEEEENENEEEENSLQKFGSRVLSRFSDEFAIGVATLRQDYESSSRNLLKEALRKGVAKANRQTAEAYEKARKADEEKEAAVRKAAEAAEVAEKEKEEKEKNAALLLQSQRENAELRRQLAASASPAPQ